MTHQRRSHHWLSCFPNQAVLLWLIGLSPAVFTFIVLVGFDTLRHASWLVSGAFLGALVIGCIFGMRIPRLASIAGEIMMFNGILLFASLPFLSSSSELEAMLPFFGLSLRLETMPFVVGYPVALWTLGYRRALSLYTKPFWNRLPDNRVYAGILMLIKALLYAVLVISGGLMSIGMVILVFVVFYLLMNPSG